MLNFRFHLVSLAAVFLALGLGLLVGASLADGGQLGQGQWSIIEEIETRLGDLRAENRRLSDELARSVETLELLDGALAQVGTEWVGESLRQRRITVFAHGTDPEAVKSVHAYLRALGAQVNPVVLSSAEGHDAHLVDALATFLLGEALRPPLDALVASGTLEFDGSLRPAEAVVVLQGSQSPLTERLVQSLMGHATVGVVGVVGAQPQPLEEADWATVPDIETPVGRLRLILQLASVLDEGEQTS